jgi:uncharacterized protein (DUF305 family)
MPVGEKTMADGTPMAGMNHMAMDLDQMYIEMMIPHHESIIALAQAALPRLTDERLRGIAQEIIATQQQEIAELFGYREEFYSEAASTPMDEAMMPEIAASMEEMALLMDANALVRAFCTADDADLAFINLTIPHHQMAIDTSRVALDQAKHPEIRDVAHRVVDAQQREIEILTAIHRDLTAGATPESS